MSRSDRRDFLKKAVLAGLFAKTSLLTYGSKLFGANPVNLPKYKGNSEDYWEIIRNEFPLTGRRTYFNTAGLGASPKRVINTMFNWINKLEEISETKHSETKEVNKKIASFLNAETDEIGITRNTTEGINIAAQSLPLKKGDEVIISTHEHVGGASPWIMLAKEIGIKIKLFNPDLSGEKNLQLFKNVVTNKTRAVCISHITCTTGLILPVKEIVKYCKSKNIYTCIDGAQAVGMIRVDLKELNPDFYAACGHKWLYGPKGSGILFINKNIINEIKPVFAGAHSDSLFKLNELQLEFRMSAQRIEYGTRNTPHTMALGAAIDFVNEIGQDKIEERVTEMAKKIKFNLQKNKRVEILSPLNEKYSSSIVTFKVKGLQTKKLLEILEKKYKFRVREIYENNLQAIRISCAVYNLDSDIEKFISAVNEITYSE